MVGNQPSGSMPTTIDSVEEFKVSTSDQTADFNSSGRCEARTMRNGIHADPSNGTTTYNLNALDPRNTGIDSVAQQVWKAHADAYPERRLWSLHGDGICDGPPLLSLKRGIPT